MLKNVEERIFFFKPHVKHFFYCVGIYKPEKMKGKKRKCLSGMLVFLFIFYCTKIGCASFFFSFWFSHPSFQSGFLVSILVRSFSVIEGLDLISYIKNTGCLTTGCLGY